MTISLQQDTWSFNSKRAVLIHQHRFRNEAARALTVLFLSACGPSVEDSIEKLGAGPDERATGKHELILADEGAVEPIIAALERQDGNKVRPDLAEVLVSRLLRSENKRIWSVLKNHLLEDPDSRVRARIAEKLGLHLRSDYFDVFLQAISDPSPAVQTPALHALANVLGQLTEEQTRTLRRLASERARSEEEAVREAALFLGGDVRRTLGKEGPRGSPQS